MRLCMAQTDITQPDGLKGSVFGYFYPWDKFSLLLGKIQGSGIFYFCGGVAFLGFLCFFFLGFPHNPPINIYIVL